MLTSLGTLRYQFDNTILRLELRAVEETDVLNAQSQLHEDDATDSSQEIGYQAAVSSDCLDR